MRRMTLLAVSMLASLSGCSENVLGDDASALTAEPPRLLPPSEAIVGAWGLETSADCASLWGFQDSGVFRFVKACRSQPASNTAFAEIREGDYAAYDDGFLDLTLRASSCPTRKNEASSRLRYRVDQSSGGDALTVETTSGRAVYVRLDPSGSSTGMVVVNGCFNPQTGAFQQAPIAPPK